MTSSSDESSIPSGEANLEVPHATFLWVLPDIPRPISIIKEAKLSLNDGYRRYPFQLHFKSLINKLAPPPPPPPPTPADTANQQDGEDLPPPQAAPEPPMAAPEAEPEDFPPPVEYTSIELESLSTSVKQFNFRISLRDVNGKYRLYEEGKLRPDKVNGEGHITHQYFISRSYVLDPNNRLLDSKGRLTVYCEVFLLENVKPLVRTDIMVSPVPNDSGSSDDEELQQHKRQQMAAAVTTGEMRSLFDSGVGSDVELVMRERTFPLHKRILISQSIVFAQLFAARPTARVIQLTTVLEGFNVDTVERFLRYLYTGWADRLADDAVELLALAEKFKIEHLKTQCNKQLSTLLDSESVTSLLLQANQFKTETFKRKCLFHIVDNIMSVLHTDGWKSLQATHPDLIKEVLPILARQFESAKKKVIRKSQ